MKGIKLPYGISNFKDLINQGYHYVDKTPFIEENMPKIQGTLTPEFNFARTFNVYDFLTLLFYNGFLTFSHTIGHFAFLTYS